MRTHDEGLIESKCFAPDPDTEYEGDRCGDQATTYVTLPSGVRRYLCPDHAADVDRFGDTDADHPKAGVCERCRKVTPVDKIETTDAVCVECSG